VGCVAFLTLGAAISSRRGTFCGGARVRAPGKGVIAINAGNTGGKTAVGRLASYLPHLLQAE
jgi:hypothetical protein